MPIQEYLAGIEGVEGWISDYSAELIADISTLQHETGIRGSLGEIGVHKGKLFILLRLTAAENERCFAIDVFGDQHLNTDRSGSGNREAFIENVTRWAGQADDLHIIQKSSLEVKAAEILDVCGPARFLSIDGGHTAQCVYNDLQLAEQIMLPDGVIVLDDFFNMDWPGVATGASQYFHDAHTKFRPFMISPNKVYVAQPHMHGFYLEKMSARQKRHFHKSSEMFSHRVDIFHGFKPDNFHPFYIKEPA